MRFPFFLALLFALMGAIGYLYTFMVLPCPIPLTYSIGELDKRFNLSREAAQASIEKSVAAWEEAAGKDLFVPQDKDGKLTINFIYDERQQLENAETAFAESLTEGKTANEALTAAYDQAVEKYEAANVIYEARMETYEQALKKFNSTVEKYNKNGGAPADEYEKLEEEKGRLASEARQLEKERNKLEDLIATINDLSERGTELVASYNKNVAAYNTNFGDSREFTQGDYQANQIHIYAFDSKAELEAVLVHELGHALSLEHVENSSSMMYYLMDEQVESFSITAEDLEEYRRVCELQPWWQLWLRQLHALV